MILRRREDDDGDRDDEAKKKAWSARSGEARVDGKTRTETLRRRRDPKVDRVVARLHEKGEEGYHEMRQDKGRRKDHKVVARAHCAAAGELGTAAAMAISGEGFRRRGCAREGEKGTR